jgi:tRNA-uridine 2-sulfurtransferase
VKKAIVGISGGIDSAVAAFLLKRDGYEVTGLHIAITEMQPEVYNQIEQIADVLKISIQILDEKKRFKDSIISYFKKEHLAGRSPSLCTYCNPHFKWEIIYEQALSTGSQTISTGHYIQKTKKNGTTYLLKGIDQKKDQSYFLWGIPSPILDMLLTPLGNKTKDETRKIARENQLDFLIKKEESTGLCFSEGLSYPELLLKYIPEAGNIKPGTVINSEGKDMGTHNGYLYYTIGQKKGLTLRSTENLCVTKINPDENTITVGHPNTLWKDNFIISDYVFRSYDEALASSTLNAKIRGFGWNPEGKVLLSQTGKNKIKVRLSKKAWAPAPGQAVVFYENDVLIGGGYIA